MISVIIPVLGEENIINNCLNRIPAGCEIIVVDGDPEGTTLSSIEKEEITGILAPPGRAVQMNEGAKQSRGDILLLLHADTEPPEGVFEAVKNIVPDRPAGAFRLEIESESPWLKLVGRAATLRSRITGVPYGDQAFFIERELFEKMGGYREIPLMEDVDMMKRLKKAGHRPVILPLSVKTSDRRWRKEGLIKCTLRSRALSVLHWLGVSPEKLAGFYPAGGRNSQRADGVHK